MCNCHVAEKVHEFIIRRFMNFSEFVGITAKHGLNQCIKTVMKSIEILYPKLTIKPLILDYKYREPLTKALTSFLSIIIIYNIVLC